MYTYHVRGTIIAPGPFIGESRLWVDREVGPVWTQKDALAAAIEEVCRDEDLSVYDVRWGPDLAVREVGISSTIKRLTPIPPPPARPARPVRSDVSVVMDYIDDLEQHIDLLEGAITAIREGHDTKEGVKGVDHVQTFIAALLYLLRNAERQAAA